MIRRSLRSAIPAVLVLALCPIASATAAPAADPDAARAPAAALDGGWLELLAHLLGLSSGGGGTVTAPTTWGGTLTSAPASATTIHDEGTAQDPSG